MQSIDNAQESLLISGNNKGGGNEKQHGLKCHEPDIMMLVRWCNLTYYMPGFVYLEKLKHELFNLYELAIFWT